MSINIFVRSNKVKMEVSSRRVLLFMLFHLLSSKGYSNPVIPNVNNQHLNKPIVNAEQPVVNDQVRHVINPALQHQQPAQHVDGKFGGAGKPDANGFHGSKNNEHNEAQRQIKRPKKFPQFKLSEVPQCREDIHKFCNQKIIDNNFEVIDCLQSDEKVAEEVSPDCQHFMWNYKRNLTHDDRFEMVAKDICKGDLLEIAECNNLEKGKGMIIPCMVDNVEEIKSKDCRRYIEKMSKIVFSDYRLIYNFADKCNDDIQKLSCGRLETQEKEESVHRQGNVMECLVRNITKLEKACKHQLLRVAELQSDDYHLDRPLYYACREARETFCPKTAAGNGRIYECLFKHKFDPAMPVQCRDKLQRRQKEVAEDVKVERTFYMACLQDMKDNGCLRMANNLGPDTRRAAVLTCLENAMKEDKRLKPECLAEMNEVRQSLLSDYRINPEIIANCESEIKACQSQVGDKAEEGAIVHCLMDMARMKKRKNIPDDRIPMSAHCKRAVEELLLEADVGSSYKMDKVLMRACNPVVKTACRNVHEGDARILNCLMDKIDDEVMTDECEKNLMEIQYFIMRDWRLDANLYKHCHQNAVSHCHASPTWNEKQSTDVNNWGLVLPCLYRNMKSDDPHLQVSRACKHELRRVMRNRARNVELDPEIEENCVVDLGTHCSDQEKDINKGDELSCLQDNYEELTDACQAVIGNITEDQDTYLDLDVVLVKACTPMLKQFCNEELDEEEDEDVVMECLIKHKHSQKMDPKCYAGIEHHQLVSMKNYEFSHKFKEACKKSVKQFCPLVRKKGDVVSCLSEHVRNDTLTETSHRIDKACRRQLRVEVLQRGEDIILDDKLQHACKEDREKYCSNVHHGNAKVIECLKAHQPKLSGKCHKVLFKREREETKLNADYKLHQVCKTMIKQYCTEEDTDVISCLVGHKHEAHFDAACRDVLLKRQIVRNRDYRLNPTLRKECKLDIHKFCQDLVDKAAPDEDMSGQVILCLRRQFIKKNLSGRCTDVIRDIIKESALNYMEDVSLANACKDEITRHCDEEHKASLAASSGSHNVVQMVQDNDKGAVEQCLKNKFKERLIRDVHCKQQIARIIQESEIDVNVDPILHTACQKDLHKSCEDVDPGEGRKMTCLLQEFEDHPNRLDKRCYVQLKKRKELWEMSVQIAPVESVNELVAQISASPAKTYLLGVICSIIGVIFLIGITCGRVTKRVSKENKMK